MTRKLFALSNALLAAVVLMPTAIITHTYIMRPRQVESLDDWFGVLLPLAPPLAALLSSLALWKIQKRTSVGKGVVWGMFVSCAVYMVLQAQILSTQFTLISQDGTAHWGMLQLPAVWFALPLLLTAVGIGGFTGWIVKRKPPKFPCGEI